MGMSALGKVHASWTPKRRKPSVCAKRATPATNAINHALRTKMVMFAMAMGSVSLMLRERRPNARARGASLGPPVLTTALAAVHRKGKQGASCKCKAGHLGRGCNLVCPQHKKVTCGGQGSCFLKNGAPKCKCKQGFMGSSCQYECPGRTAKTSCSGKGKCTLVGGKKGKGFKTKCLCKKGYGGRTCEQSCPFKKATSGKSKGKTVPCFGKGDCVANKTGMKCMCKKGWLGKDCSSPCPTSKNGEICSRRGLCTLSSKKKPKCDCKDGYIGRSCSATCPRSAGKICSGHGKCISGKGGTAGCKCHKDYAGATCSQGCPKDKNGTICNGNGKCQLKNNKAICKCNAGHQGKDCEQRVCSTANSLFDKKTSRCLCEPGYPCCSRKKMAMIMASESTDDLSEFNV